MMQALSIIERLNEVLRDGSEKQRLLVDHIFANLRECSYASTRDLAAQQGVDVATVVRLSQRLGFARYDDFRQSLRAHYLSTLEPIDLLQEQSHVPATDVAENALRQDLRVLSHLVKNVDYASLRALAKQITEARRIVVVGFGEHGGVAITLAHLLSYMGLDVVSETRGSIYLSAQVANLGPADLLISFSFWRPARDTVQAFAWCHKRGIRTAVVSDSATSRIAREADHKIVVPCEATSFFQTMTAALSAVHALAALVAASGDERVTEAIQRSRAYNREFGIVVS